MRTHALASCLFLALAALQPLDAQTRRLSLELEGGAGWQSSNNVEIPNDGSATRFSLKDLTGTGPWPFGRAYLTWNINDRHGLRALYAPLSITETGVPAENIDFEGERFSSGIPVEATYKFNSYRLTYRYRVRETDRASAWIGFTGKIRDATVELEQGTTSSRKDNVGLVPLLHLAGEWRTAPRWHVSADVDGLAGGPGRAIDGALKIGYDVRDNLALRVGYRTLEGGADVDDTYNFAWLHYAVASITWRR